MAPTILSKLWKLSSKILSIIPAPSFDLPESSVEPTVREEISGSSASSVKSTIAEEIEKLRQMVAIIQATVIDEEERDVTDASVKLKLLDLKQVAYEGENILNDFDYELLSAEVQRKVQVNNPKRKFEVIDSIVSPTFDESILLRIKKVNERFDEISQFWTVLSLSEVDGIRKSQANTRPPTDSLMNYNEVFGRHDYKSHIISNMLPEQYYTVEPDPNTQSGSDNIKVISIVSMGGMGKTTLAKLVYNDEMVQKHFDVRSWVWVSKSFDEEAIARSIWESVVQRSCDFVNLNHLRMELKEKLRGKRFLLVLDDLWNENSDCWNTILRPLLNGAEGSSILITTRNSNVAEIARTNTLVPLGGLPENDSWALFCQYAFSRVQPSSLPKKLVEIGQKIAEKCKGVPLLIKTLGCLLAHETKEDYWEYILGSEVWELDDCKMSIIPILKLSYYSLPSHLKPCFTYCAVFPKGYVFELENLVHLWIAQGFIENCPKREMEEIGIMYAHDLLQRSFFQDVPIMNSTNKVTMHDLMHDLAQAITGEEIFVTDNLNLHQVCNRKNLRHLTILVKNEEPILLERYFDGISLKSLIITGCNKANFLLEENFFDNPCFTNLYVLDLNFWESDEVPSSISNLKQLRYLGLSGQKLPESTCDLYHLKTLNLRTSERKCQFRRPAARELPTNIDHLINLRHLLFDPYDITRMPKGIGSLTNLQSLPFFPLGNNHESASLGELRKLNNLHGLLKITDLDHTIQEQSLLESKKHLNHLILSFRLGLKSKKYELHEVLKCLRPHNNIQQIEVNCYEGEQLPSWFEDYSFSMLTNLKLYSCTECKQLPAIGQLPNLKYLKLEEFSSLENVGNELLGNKKIAFPSLEVLVLYKMYNLTNWHFGEERGIFFPCLREVQLSLCNNLYLFQLPTSSPLVKINVSWCDCLEIIDGLEGSWSVINQWKSILDSSEGEDDENISILHSQLEILDSRVLKLERKSAAGKSLPEHLILTLVGCPLLQKSLLTCTSDKDRPTTGETSSLVDEEEIDGVYSTIQRSLRKKKPDLVNSGVLTPQTLLTTVEDNLGEVNYLRRTILHSPTQAQAMLLLPLPRN